MVRFLHTSDLQLGMRAREATAAAARLRDARFETLRKIVQTADEARVDFVIVAGDLFEDNQVDAVTVQRAVQTLQQASVPVYVLPGNHDWLDRGSVYGRADFAPGHCGKVHVFREAAPVSVGDACTLYPCPNTQRWSMADPTDWIPARAREDRVRIGIAHGSLRTVVESPEFPIAPDAASARGLDYLALGDWHGMQIYDAGRIAYPGTPEQTSFGEDPARIGGVLIVEIEGPGRPPQIRQHPVATLTWLDWSIELAGSAKEELERLRDRIESLPDGGNCLLRMTLSGVIPANDLPLVEQLRTGLQARCQEQRLLYADLRSQVKTSEALEGSLRALVDSEPVLAGVVADLGRMATIDGGAMPDFPEEPRDVNELIRTWSGIEPGELDMSTVAREALGLLARLSSEVA